MFFDEARKRGTPIDLQLTFQTKKGTKIELFTQHKPAAPFMLKQYEDLRKKHNWHLRKPPTPGYNCVGHVLAVRRGEVDVKDVPVILREDEYRKLPPGEEPAPGDVVTYTDIKERIVLHIGLIVQVRPLLSGLSTEKAPQILSKMDGGSGEYLHEVEAVHYGNKGRDYEVDYWTDRPLLSCSCPSEEPSCILR
jgi:hypothetical protein